MTYIKKEPIIEFITKGLNNPDNSKAYGHDAIEILAEIEYTPTTDVQEVVRCKDCKHKFTEYDGSFTCNVFSNSYGLPYRINPDDFCSRGEKKGE